MAIPSVFRLFTFIHTPVIKEHGFVKSSERITIIAYHYTHRELAIGVTGYSCASVYILPVIACGISNN